jgi:hypothetical protein
MFPFLQADARLHIPCRTVKRLVLRVAGDRAGETIDTSVILISNLV